MNFSESPAVTVARDILYVRYQLADLDSAEAFMTDFGLTTVQHDAKVLRMRGAEAAPFIYEAVKGDENRFLGVGFSVRSRATLQHLASLPGSSPVAPLDAKEGGEFVRMQMSDGFLIDAVWSSEHPADCRVRGPFSFNAGHRKQRTNASIRQRAEAAPALRLGHVVLHVSDHREAVRWLNERLGLIASDHFGPPPGRIEDAVGSFMRVDAGGEYVDHHCLLVLESKRIGVHHCSFELQDIDHLMAAHDYLLARGYRLDCGVGRHLLGSQIYDYWRDPAGFRVEHYTDGDIVNAQHTPTVFTGSADETTQWGMAPDKAFFD